MRAGARERTPIRALLVEDDARIARAWASTLRSAGVKVEIARSLQQAVSSLDGAHGDPGERPFDVILVDICLPDGDGSALLDELEGPGRPSIAVVSGFLDSDKAVDLVGRCEAVVPKPITNETLVKLVNNLAHDRLDAMVDAFCDYYSLSGREGEVLRLCAEGFGNEEAIEELATRRGTFATYWRRIHRKTRCHSQRDVISALLRFSLRDIA